MLLWEFRGVYRMKERNRGNVRGRRTGREKTEDGKGEGQKGREEDKETQKKLVPTHCLWLCTSESTCSLSKGQSWSCLPETGGKGWDGGTAQWQVEGWGPKHTVGGGGAVCARIRAAQWWRLVLPGCGAGALSPTRPRHDAVSQRRHRKREG